MGKTFVLKPLTKIYNCFSVPAPASLRWIDADNTEIIFFNNMRYEHNAEKYFSDILEWSNLLNMLEGKEIKIKLPKITPQKTLFGKKAKQPIFATGCERIKKFVNNLKLKHESEQMDARWNYITFTWQVENSDGGIPAWPRCFTHHLLGGEDLPEKIRQLLCQTDTQSSSQNETQSPSL